MAGVAPGHFNPEVSAGVMLEDVSGFFGRPGPHAAPETAGCGDRVLFDKVMKMS